MSKITPFLQLITKRSISLSAPREGKRNFRKFVVANKRGSRIFKERQAGPNPELPIDRRGVRDTGYFLNGRFVKVPEMIPELIVPDLKDCDLKPYVSYKAEDVTQGVFTSEDLFNAVYSKKIVTDFRQGKLDADGNPLEPSDEEKLQAEEAVARAKRTGSDIF
ncbi:mitochondrial ribosomal protein l27 domain-containing protein [Phthorimaea operculella]|nr:mitochondrial ribosomal protein l27 domain-containing protein [Phthorimaea operculella]KAI5637556.1 mitochondrial ribosomal protein l27 domain-containing protein [Phthorimaea operculella]